ncbi:unnamed protein product, partial [Aphanomyces euteiches]
MKFLAAAFVAVAASPSYICFEGKDYGGDGDIETVPGHTKEDCQEACNRRTECNAVAWYKDHCYLKALEHRHEYDVDDKPDVITCKKMVA